MSIAQIVNYCCLDPDLAAYLIIRPAVIFPNVPLSLQYIHLFLQAHDLILQFLQPGGSASAILALLSQGPSQREGEVGRSATRHFERPSQNPYTIGGTSGDKLDVCATLPDPIENDHRLIDDDGVFRIRIVLDGLAAVASVLRPPLEGSHVKVSCPHVFPQHPNITLTFICGWLHAYRTYSQHRLKGSSRPTCQHSRSLERSSRMN